jgi:hypothetical protein
MFNETSTLELLPPEVVDKLEIPRIIAMLQQGEDVSQENPERVLKSKLMLDVDEELMANPEKWGVEVVVPREKIASGLESVKERVGHQPGATNVVIYGGGVGTAEMLSVSSHHPIAIGSTKGDGVGGSGVDQTLLARLKYEFINNIRSGVQCVIYEDVVDTGYSIVTMLEAFAAWHPDLAEQYLGEVRRLKKFIELLRTEKNAPDPFYNEGYKVVSEKLSELLAVFKEKGGITFVFIANKLLREEDLRKNNYPVEILAPINFIEEAGEWRNNRWLMGGSGWGMDTEIILPVIYADDFVEWAISIGRTIPDIVALNPGILEVDGVLMNPIDRMRALVKYVAAEMGIIIADDSNFAWEN